MQRAAGVYHLVVQSLCSLCYSSYISEKEHPPNVTIWGRLNMLLVSAGTGQIAAIVRTGISHSLTHTAPLPGLTSSNKQVIPKHGTGHQVYS